MTEIAAHRHGERGLLRCNRCDVVLLEGHCVWCEGGEAPVKANCPLVSKYPA